MFKTTTVTELRSDLAGYLNRLRDGPVIVLSRSRPTAVLLEPQIFDGLLDRIELLEDLIDGRRALAELHETPSVAVDANEVFARLGL